MAKKAVRTAPKIKKSDMKCGHPSWWFLNDTYGCIHEDHGPWPRGGPDAKRKSK